MLDLLIGFLLGGFFVLLFRREHRCCVCSEKNPRQIQFSGEPDEDVEDFIAGISKLQLLNQWADCEAVRYVISNLVGNASFWLDYKKFKISGMSWEFLKRELRKMYGKQVSEMEALREVIQMKYQPGTNFETFVWRFRAGCLKANPNIEEREIVELILSGLDKQARFLFSREFTGKTNWNIVDIICHFRAISNMLPGDLEPTKVDARTEASSNLVSVAAEEEPAAGRFEGRKRVRCFRCRKAGHLARACPTKKAAKQPIVSQNLSAFDFSESRSNTNSHREGQVMQTSGHHAQIQLSGKSMIAKEATEPVVLSGGGRLKIDERDHRKRRRRKARDSGFHFRDISGFRDLISKSGF